MRRSDIVIVGGGVIGMMTGWFAAKARARVIVVDSGGPAATTAAAGMLAPSFEKALHKAGAALANFAAKSLADWRVIAPELVDKSGVDIDFDDAGVLSAVFDNDDAALFDADKEGGEWLNVSQALAAEPFLSPNIAGAWRATDNGQVDPRKALAALKSAFCLDGGEIVCGKRAVLILSDGGRVRGVTLDNGERLLAPAVVLATGARIAGLAPLPEGAVFPVKGEALALSRGEGAPRHVVRTSRAYLCPKSDGRIVIGATEVKKDWSLNADVDRISALRNGAVAAFPGLARSAEYERWAGLRPATHDGAPIIGAAPDGPSGLFYALGHYRNGVLLAPATACALRGILLEGGPDPEAAFSAVRFHQLGVS